MIEKKPLRVATLIPGARKGLQPVKYAAFRAALEAEVSDVPVWSIEPSQLERLWVALRTFHPDKTTFRARFYASPLAFHARSRDVARQVARSSAGMDAFLQIGATFDAGAASERGPLVIYTDYTIALTRDMGRSYRLGLSDAQIEECVRLERLALSRARMICSRSAFVADAIVSEMGVPSDRVAVVGAGPNINATGVRAKPPRLLFFGNEFHRKGGDLVLDAFARLRAEFDWLEMDIVAPSSAMIPYAGVTWHSGIGADRIAALLGRASILLAPSRFETWGDVVVEGMAGGAVPVIVDVPPMTEIVRDGVEGLVVRPEDAGELARAVRSLLIDPCRMDALSQSARRRVEQNLNQQTVAARVAEHIRAAINGVR